MRHLRRLALVASLAVLASTSSASAQFFPGAEEPPPGLTITGTGLERIALPDRLNESSVQAAVDAARPSAVRRAIDDAHRRAEAVAQALGIQVGEIDELEVDDAFPQFRPQRAFCRRRRPARGARCRVPAFAAASATVTFAIVGGSNAGDDVRTVEAYGSASGAVDPRNPRGNFSIRQAVAATRLAVTPAAAGAARREAEGAATAADLRLGPVVSVSEDFSPFGYPYDPTVGSFAPGRFCGPFRRPIFRVDRGTGRRHFVRTVRRRRCVFPRTLSLRFVATFEAERP